MIYENDASWNTLMTTMAAYVESFKDGEKWWSQERLIFNRFLRHGSIILFLRVSVSPKWAKRESLCLPERNAVKSYRAPHQAIFSISWR